MEISTVPYYNEHIPAFEVTIPDSGLDRKYFEDQTLWKSNKLVDSDTHPFDETRLILNRQSDNQQPISDFCGNYLNSELALKEIEKVWNTNYNLFYKVWPFSKQKFKSVKEFLNFWVLPAGDAMMDRPNHKMHAHYDNRGVFGNIIVNLTDNECSTVFLKPFTNEVLFYGPIEKNKGIFFLNCADTYHNIEHRGNSNRFIHTTALTLKQIF